MLGRYVWKVLSSRRQRAINQRITGLLAFVDQVIASRLAGPSEGTFLDAYLDYARTQKQVPKDEMTQQFITLFNAGTDTTSYLISTCLYFLAENQQVQETIYQEVASLWPIDYEKLQKLVHLGAFINESLRLYTPFQSLFPRRVIQDVLINGITVKKGWLVGMNM